MNKKKTCHCKSIKGVGKAHAFNCVFCKKKTVSGDKDYYALLCKCGEKPNEHMIMAVMSSRKEAQKIAWHPDLQGCPAVHVIKKCKVTITL